MRKFIRILVVIVLCLVLIGIWAPDWLRFGGYHYKHASRYTAGGAALHQKVENLDISWISGKVKIERHKGDEIILSETCDERLKEAEEVHWLVEDDTLYVKFVRSGKRYSSKLNKNVTLKLPEKMNLEHVLISTVSAGVEADLPKAERMEMNGVSGGVDVTLEKADTVKLSTVSGDALLSFAAAPRRIDANGVSASLTVELPENTGFTADLDSVSGHISGQLLDGLNSTKAYTRGDGDCTIHMDTVSGNLRLDAYDR